MHWHYNIDCFSVMYFIRVIHFRKDQVHLRFSSNFIVNFVNVKCFINITCRLSAILWIVVVSAFCIANEYRCDTISWSGVVVGWCKNIFGFHARGFHPFMWKKSGSRTRWFWCYIGLGMDIVGFTEDVVVVVFLHGTNIHWWSNCRLCGNNGFCFNWGWRDAEALMSEVEVAVVLMGCFAIILWNNE